MPSSRRRRRATFLSVFALLLTATAPPSAADAAPSLEPAWASEKPAFALPSESGLPLWQWPVDGERSVIAAYRAPAHEYGAGHRGIDVAATSGGAVLAPADGIVAFSGTVADRPLVTIRHDDGLVSTLEPVASALLPGAVVHRGEPVGALASGGHTPPGTLHLGVRLDGAYINPLLLYGGAPRAVLLPCCDG